MWEDEVSDLKPIKLNPPSQEAQQRTTTLIQSDFDEDGILCVNFSLGNRRISYFYETTEEAEADVDALRGVWNSELDQFGQDRVDEEQKRVIAYLKEQANGFSKKRGGIYIDQVGGIIEQMIGELFPRQEAHDGA